MHLLHKLIAKIISEANFPDVRPVAGKECGGTQNIQLFCKDNATRGTCYCYVDEVILKNDQVKVVIEIEESDIRPVALIGKVCISAVASHFIHRRSMYPMAEGTSFVQIIDTKKLSKKSSKLQQCQNLTGSVNHLLGCLHSNINRYQIFYGDLTEFESKEAQDELRQFLSESVST